MVALPAPPSFASRSTVEPRQTASATILIRVPDVRPSSFTPLHHNAHTPRRPGRRLRRDRVAVALTPIFALAGVLAWGPTLALLSAVDSPTTVATDVNGESSSAIEPLLLSRVALTIQPADAEPPHDALTVQPAGYLLPVFEPGDLEGSSHHAYAGR